MALKTLSELKPFSSALFVLCISGSYVEVFLFVFTSFGEDSLVLFVIFTSAWGKLLSVVITFFLTSVWINKYPGCTDTLCLTLRIRV